MFQEQFVLSLFSRFAVAIALRLQVEFTISALLSQKLNTMSHRLTTVVLLACFMAIVGAGSSFSETPNQKAAGDPKTLLRRFVESHCVSCHDRATKTAGLALDDLLTADVGKNRQTWESVVRML